MHPRLQPANRDPDVFDLPDWLDLGCDVRRHIAFGNGVYLQPPARVELQIALPTLLARFPASRVAVPYDQIAYRHGTTVHGGSRAAGLGVNT